MSFTAITSLLNQLSHQVAVVSSDHALLENSPNLSTSIGFHLLSDQPILIFGKDGQVGKALFQIFNEFKLPIVFIGRSECDLEQVEQITAILNRYQPKVIINAAAYTAVDLAEKEPKKARAINAVAVEMMAHYIAHVSKGVLVHYSTDYVFDGKKQTPYIEEDIPNPISQYGKSKLAGEQAILEAFQSPLALRDAKITPENSHLPRYYILRTSWVYGDGKNFIRTMLQLASQKEELKVIHDQVGCPNSSQWLAQIAIQCVFSSAPSGIYHAVVDGHTSWHGLAMFAIETARQAGEGVLVKSENILGIPATEYPLPAPRPYNSGLNNQKLKDILKEMPYTDAFPHWEEQVGSYVRNYVRDTLKN